MAYDFITFYYYSFSVALKNEPFASEELDGFSGFVENGDAVTKGVWRFGISGWIEIIFFVVEIIDTFDECY